MFVLTSQFEIGRFRFRGCNACRVEKSVHQIDHRATITLPATAVTKYKDIELPSRQTAKQFAVGDKVKIRLGYNGELKDEFIGFVSRIDIGRPVVIECEGMSWLLRKKKNIKKTWESTTLKDVLTYVIDGLDGITLHPDIPDMPLENLAIDNASGTQVIEYLKGLTNGALTAYFTDSGQLYMGLTYADTAKVTVRHRLGWNTIGEGSLKQHRAEDTEVKIEVVYKDEGGSTVTTEAGKAGGIVRKEKLGGITDAASIKAIAEAKLAQESFDGMEGTLETFLIPYCTPGMKQELSDPRYPEREGNYFLEKTVTDFGQSGGRRSIDIGLRLS